MALVANLAAYDCRLVSAARLIVRTTRTLATMERMQRYRGHFYNWYGHPDPRAACAALRLDRRQRQSHGHLVTLAEGLDELARSRGAADPGRHGETLDVIGELAASWAPR